MRWIRTILPAGLLGRDAAKPKQVQLPVCASVCPSRAASRGYAPLCAWQFAAAVLSQILRPRVLRFSADWHGARPSCGHLVF